VVSTSYTARTKCRWLWREFRREILAAGVGGGERPTGGGAASLGDGRVC